MRRNTRAWLVRLLTCFCLLAVAAPLFAQSPPPASGRPVVAPASKPQPEQIERAATKTAGLGSVVPRLEVNYGKLPLSFEPNQGQTDPSVKFLSHGRGYGLFLTGNEAVVEVQVSEKNRPLSLVPGPLPVAETNRSGAMSTLQPTTDHGPRTNDQGQMTKDSVLRMKLVHANQNAQVIGGDELPGKVNYFIGNDPKKWRTNVPTYSQVRYRNVYPGIDLVYHGNQSGQLEFDFVVAPGADPGAIALAVEAAGEERKSKIENRNWKVETGNSQLETGNSLTDRSIQIAADGDLVIPTPDGEVVFHKPVVYQEQSTVDSPQLTVQDETRNSKIDDRHSPPFTIYNSPFTIAVYQSAYCVPSKAVP